MSEVADHLTARVGVDAGISGKTMDGRPSRWGGRVMVTVVLLDREQAVSNATTHIAATRIRVRAEKVMGFTSKHVKKFHVPLSTLLHTQHRANLLS